MVDPLVHPGKDFLVPFEGVLRLEHPVVLAGEAQVARGHASHLQRREHTNPLRFGQAEIIRRMDHQMRRLEILYKPFRRELQIMFPELGVPGLAADLINRAELGHREPELIGGVEVIQRVEHAIVRDQTPEPIRLPLNEVDHIPAIGGPHGAAPLETDPLKAAQIEEPLHQVIIGRGAPVIPDIAFEGAFLAGRAAGVDHTHGEALKGENLGVPAQGPLRQPGDLRPPVDQERKGIFLIILKLLRLEGEALNGLSVVARIEELLRQPQLLYKGLFGVQFCEIYE